MTDTEKQHEEYKRSLIVQPVEQLMLSPWLLGVRYSAIVALSSAIHITAPKICRGVSFHYPHALAINVLIPTLCQGSKLQEHKRKVNRTKTSLLCEEVWKWHCTSLDTMNSLFWDAFSQRTWCEEDGSLDFNPRPGTKAKGGLLVPLICDSHAATITYCWTKQKCTIQFFLQKYSAVYDFLTQQLYFEELAQ